MTGVISRNKVVYITYSILDESGQVFEQHDLPIGYVHGVNSPLLEKIEMALEGHSTGDRIEGGKLTVDGNHLLAGKTVQYVVNVAAVRDATSDEIASGLPNDAINMPLH